MSDPARRTLDVVVPVFNEALGLEAFHRELTCVTARLPYDVTIWYVNDGSTDDTAAVLMKLAAESRRTMVVELSRNFGHQAALSAGLEVATGAVVVTMDGDGQHPPALLTQLVQQFEAGYDVVLTRRTAARQPGRIKRSASAAFYWVLSRLSETAIPPGSADFRLISREVADALRSMPEYHRFLRGMIAWLGYRSVVIPYVEQPRAAGRSKFPLRRMLRLAMDAIFSFSLVPLQIGIGLGVCLLILAGLEVAYVLSFWVRGMQHRLVPGWASLMFMLLLVGGTVMIVVGFVGIYVGYIFQEVKRRPVYVIRRAPRRSPSEGGSAERA